MAKKQKYETVFLLQSFGSKKSRNEEETKKFAVKLQTVKLFQVYLL